MLPPMNDLSQLPGLVVSLVPSPPSLLLQLGGELDFCTRDELPWDEYASRPDLTSVLVDLRELTFCDVAGLRALATFRAIHEARGRSVEVVLDNPLIRRVMRLCGFTDRLEFTRPATSGV